MRTGPGRGRRPRQRKLHTLGSAPAVPGPRSGRRGAARRGVRHERRGIDRHRAITIRSPDATGTSRPALGRERRAGRDRIRSPRAAAGRGLGRRPEARRRPIGSDAPPLGARARRRTPRTQRRASCPRTRIPWPAARCEEIRRSAGGDGRRFTHGNRLATRVGVPGAATVITGTPSLPIARPGRDRFLRHGDAAPATRV